MQLHNRNKLEALRPVLVNKSGTAEEVDEILRIVREEWDKHYSLNAYCDSCKLKLVEYAFQMMDNLK